MLSIGEFSKLCGVTTKTLRYYAEIGLIIPSEVSIDSGYRYYAIEQLKTMLFINRLKLQRFSLEEIKQIVHGNQDDQEQLLYQLLTKKSHDIQHEVQVLASTQQLIQADLASLRQGVSVMAYLDDIDVELVDVAPMTILSIRKLLSQEECQQGYVGFFDQLFKRIDEDSLTRMGMPMTMYHNKEFDAAEQEVEFAIPIAEYVTGTREFNAGLCARTIIRGVYSELMSIHAKQRRWAEAEGYHFISSPFEIYQKSPEDSEKHVIPEESITAFYYPVKKNK